MGTFALQTEEFRQFLFLYVEIAKVSTLLDHKLLNVVPIIFASGAGWDSLKGVYTIPLKTADALTAKKINLSVTANGTIAFLAASH